MKIVSLLFRAGIIFFWIGCLIVLLAIASVGSLSQNVKTINVLTYPATLDQKIIAEFEKETGIRVNLIYYENNEELFVKLLTTKGQGYDLFMPSDYSVERFIKHGLMKPIDKSKLNFWHRINPRVIGQYFDPENIYTIPFFWTVYGLGINRNFFDKKIPDSWQLLFDYSLSHAKVGMFNLAREALLTTALYLFGGIENLTEQKIKQIQTILVNQKKNVEAYIDADFRANYLLASDASPVVVAASTFIAQLMKENEAIDFILPREGTFILIDSWALPTATTKDDLVYQFINFLFKPSALLHLFQNYPFFPVTNDLKMLMEENEVPESIIRAHFDTKLKLEFFKNVLSDESANNVWITVKTS
jgi:spermidine/putrescine transport system substrate-binding protein